MLLGLVGIAVYLMANGYRYLWLAFVILAAIGLSFSMELVLPYEGEWNRAHDDIGKDVAHGVVYELGNLVTLGLLLLISLGLPALDLWPRALPFAVQFLLALLIADCVMTMIHYLSHRVARISRKAMRGSSGSRSSAGLRASHGNRWLRHVRRRSRRDDLKRRTARGEAHLAGG
jgi:sterol desaturase/sphingolipid hydroxylase (fatty acid hydroxylase superfamily)